jgi:hypothetical protein
MSIRHYKAANMVGLIHENGDMCMIPLDKIQLMYSEEGVDCIRAGDRNIYGCAREDFDTLMYIWIESREQ